jgi:hypothetical protein
VPKIEYVPRRFSPATMDVITTAEAICQEYAGQGYDLTLRQLYYQFVARGLLANRQTEYKRLGSIVNDARLAGLIDWDHVTDRTRNLRDLAHWDDPESIISASASQYRTDRWADQDYRVEVWVEKDALTGVIARSAQALDVPWFSCRGYTSQSELWGAAMRHRRHERHGQKVVVIHLGDHDPSGIDMSRDIADRLALFGAATTVWRIALNMVQVLQYDPPPNPAKLTDSRAEGYIARHGESSWELDALDPTVLDGLITEAVQSYRDEGTWTASTEAMQQQREALVSAARRWDEVVDWLDAEGSEQ